MPHLAKGSLVAITLVAGCFAAPSMAMASPLLSVRTPAAAGGSGSVVNPRISLLGESSTPPVAILAAHVGGVANFDLNVRGGSRSDPGPAAETAPSVGKSTAASGSGKGHGGTVTGTGGTGGSGTGTGTGTGTGATHEPKPIFVDLHGNASGAVFIQITKTPIGASQTGIGQSISSFMLHASLGLLLLAGIAEAARRHIRTGGFVIG